MLFSIPAGTGLASVTGKGKCLGDFINEVLILRLAYLQICSFLPRPRGVANTGKSSDDNGWKVPWGKSLEGEVS